MSADLIWAINSLLRPRQQTTMGPPKARDPIPARLGVADWGFELESVGPPLSYMEDGWFRYQSVSAGIFSYLYPRNDDQTYGPYSASAALGKQFTGAIAPCNANIQNNQALIYNRGTMYSGRMREVVQLLCGASDPIPYSYHWCKTHGVFLNSIDSSWWVVEISAGGVRAWLMPIAQTLTEDEQSTLGITIPFLPGKDSLSMDGDRELMAASAIGDVYSWAWGYYAEHGWAFSYSGHSAEIISITQPDIHQIATRWRVEITADDDGNPVSASLTEEEQAYIWGPRSAAPKYPHYTDAGPTLLSYDMYYNAPYAPTGNTAAPLDVFFIGTNEIPVVIRYGQIEGSDEEELPSNRPDVNGACFDYILLEEGDTDYYNSTYNKELLPTTSYEFDGISKPAATEQQWVETSTGAIVHSTVSLAGEWIADSLSDVVYQYYYNGRADVAGGGSTQLSYSETVFKPQLDREVIGLYRKTRKLKSRGAGQSYYNDLIVGGGYYDNAAYSSYEASCGGNGYAYKYSEDLCGQVWTFNPMPDLAIGKILHPLVGWEMTTTPAVGVCPNNIRYLMEGCATGELINSACTGYWPFDAVVNQYYDERTDTWLSTKAGSWKSVYGENSYSASDVMSDYVSDPSLGTVRFSAHLDVFTNRGMTYSEANNNAANSMVIWGSTPMPYPLKDDDPTPYCGWCGVPFID